MLSRLGDEYTAKGKSRLWEQFQPYLTGATGAAPYTTVAAALEISEGAVKVAVHRLRQRYRELLREEIGQTVESSGEVDDELAILLAALRGGES